MGSQGREDSWQGGSWKTGTGEAASGRLGKAVAGRVDGPIFACG